MKGNATHFVSVIPDTESIGHSFRGITHSETYVGFRAVCTCDWQGPFREADETGEGYSHDTAHRQATTDGEEHEGRQA